MQDIYRESGLNAGVVYRYFKSKDDIIDALCSGSEDGDARVFEAALALDNTISSLEELLKQFFGPLETAEVQSVTSLWVHIWGEETRKISLGVVTPPDTVPAIESLAQLVRRAQDRNEIDRSLDAEAVARVMVSLLQGLILQLARHRRIDLAAYVAVVRALLLGRFWVARQHRVP